MASMRIEPEFALQTLKTSLLTAEDAAGLIDMGVEFRNKDTISEGLEILTGAVSDAAYVIEQMGETPGLGAAPRRGAEPWLPEEMIQALETANAVDEVAIETLLRTRSDLPLDQEKLLIDQIFRLLRTMEARTVALRARIKEQWPGFWDMQHDALFAKYLKPRRRR